MALEGEQIGFVEKTIKMIEKYGLWKVVRAIILILLFLFGMYWGSSCSYKSWNYAR